MQNFLFSLCVVFNSINTAAQPVAEEYLVFAEGNIKAHVWWEKAPNGSSSESKMGLEWLDGKSMVLIEPGQSFSVSLWMPGKDNGYGLVHPGHGSAPTQIKRVLNERGQVILGTYLVTNMYFIMTGQWQINVTLKYSNNREETKTWTVEVGGHKH